MGERAPWRWSRDRALDSRGDGGRGGRYRRSRSQARARPQQRSWHRRNAARRRGVPASDRRRERARRPYTDAPRLVKESGFWHAEQAWLGRPARDVLIEVEDGRIKTVTEGAAAPAGAVELRGWT